MEVYILICCRTVYALAYVSFFQEGSKGMTTFSQFGQDVYTLTNIYPGVTNGYFVEVGAYDGVNMSNTLLMEQNGWSGLCIEPNPRLFAQMTRWRHCLKSQYAVFNTDDAIVEFYDDPTGGCSSIVETDVSANRFPVIRVATKTLTTLLNEHNAPSFIHYLSLDTEGSEYEILNAHNFSAYTFGYICVEHNFHEENRAKIRSLLESKGYLFHRTNHVDDEYCLRELPSVLSYLKTLSF